MTTFVPVYGLMKLALGQLSTSTGIAQSAGFSLLAAATGVANVPGMFESVAEWDSLKNSIDEIKTHLDQVFLDVKSDWIADDREAFNAVIQEFKKELDDVKSYLGAVKETMDAVAKLYGALWLAIITLATLGLAFLLLLLALFFTPYAPAAKAKAEMIGGWMSTLTNVAVKVAATALTAMTAILGLCAIGVARAMGIRIGAAPTGGNTGREDFRQVQIEYRAPTQYIVPNKPLPA